MYVAGFPGVGKSHWCKLSPTLSSDSDSSTYSKLPDGTPNPNFIEDYFNVIEKINVEPGMIVFTSTHELVLCEFVKRRADYIVLIPEEGLLEEYVERYTVRQSPPEFIKLIKDNWYTWLQNIKSNHRYHELKSGESVTSYLIETYEKY